MGTTHNDGIKIFLLKTNQLSMNPFSPIIGLMQSFSTASTNSRNFLFNINGRMNSLYMLLESTTFTVASAKYNDLAGFGFPYSFSGSRIYNTNNWNLYKADSSSRQFELIVL